MAIHNYKTETRGSRFELRDFVVIFLTLAILGVLAIARFSTVRSLVVKKEVEIAIGKIISLEKNFGRDRGRYGSLTEIGFANPFADNRVEFSIALDPSGFVVQAIEHPLIDAFGDKIPGNQYYIGYSNGTIEFNKKH